MEKKPWVKAPNNTAIIKQTILNLTGKKEIEGMDYLVDYFGTLYNEERHLTRIVNRDNQSVRKGIEDTKTHLYLEEHIDILAKICDYRLREHYREEYNDSFVAVPDGYTVNDVPRGFPTQKRRTTTAFPITDQEMKARYLKNPLIPVLREGNVVKFMGLDSKTKKPVLFAMSIDNDKATNCQNILLVLEAHGDEEGIINIDRLTCNPTTKHEDFERDENGKIVVDSFGMAKIKTVSCTYTSNHNFCMEDRLTDPNGYSARVNEVDKDLYISQNIAYRKEVTQDGKVEIHPATFDDALSIFMNDHNIFHCQTPRYNKGSTFRACMDIDFLLEQHFDSMILADNNTPFTYEEYLELGQFAQDIVQETNEELLQNGQNLDLDNPATKRLNVQNQTQTNVTSKDPVQGL